MANAQQVNVVSNSIPVLRKENGISLVDGSKSTVLDTAPVFRPISFGADIGVQIEGNKGTWLSDNKVVYYDGTSRKELGAGSNPQLFKNGVLFEDATASTGKLYYFDGQNTTVVSDKAVNDRLLIPQIDLGKGLALWKEQDGKLVIFDGQNKKFLDGSTYFLTNSPFSVGVNQPLVLELSADRVIFRSSKIERVNTTFLEVLYTDPQKQSLSFRDNDFSVNPPRFSSQYIYYSDITVSSDGGLQFNLMQYDGKTKKTIGPVDSFKQAFVAGNDLYYLGIDNNSIQQLYKYDGNQSTVVSQNKLANYVIQPFVSNGKVIFAAHDGNDSEVYSYDGRSLTQITDNNISDNAQISGDLSKSSVVSPDGSTYFWVENLGNSSEPNFEGTIYNVAKNQFTKIRSADLPDGQPKFDANNNLLFVGVLGVKAIALGGQTTGASEGLNILGTSGNDNIFGANGSDTLVGADGDDTIFGRRNNDFLYGGNGNDIIDGEDGNDSVLGGNGQDSLYGADGSDTLYGESGNDYIDGGNGNDVLGGGGGNDVLFGDYGNDVLYADSGDDTMFGGIGEDLIRGGDGNNFLGGDDGKDTLFGGSGNDSLYGGSGFDSLSGDAGNDFLLGEEGEDRLFGGVGNDTLFGGNDNDSLVGDSGNDILDGEGGTDSLFGGIGNDSLYGADGDDSLSGEAGNDFLNGGDSNDFLRGGSGDDLLDGDTGNDILDGEDGNDRLIGGTDDDSLYGANGNDILIGGEGADYLNGDNGLDVLTGGAGNDIFAGFSANAANGDTITDFQVGIDKIALSKVAFSALQSLVGNGFSSITDFAVVADTLSITSSKALIVYNSKDGSLTYNQNRDAAGLGTGSEFAKLTNLPAGLSANDFQIVG
jgi:Ca2+-binding RTX toxin-like protein